MPTSSFDKNIELKTQSEVEAFCDALDKSEKWAEENREHEPQEVEYIADIADIFPWVERGEMVNVRIIRSNSRKKESQTAEK
jgi:hypothetical protein